MRSKRIWQAMWVAVAILMGGYAHSQDCDLRVNDQAGVFGDTGAIERAANILADKGADVRVWSLATLGGASNLDFAEKQIEGRCESWRSPGGGRKSNLLALIVSMNPRKIGLYFGGQYQFLDGHWQRIQSDHIKPKLVAGDISGGMAAGINEVARMAEGVLHPSAPPIQKAPIVVVRERAPRKPMDLSWLGWVFGLALLIGAGFFSARAYNAAQRNSARRKVVQLRAKNAKSSCATAITELDTAIGEFELRVTDIAQSMCEEDRAAILAIHDRVKDAHTEAMVAFSNIDQSANDPNTSRTVEEYTEIEGSFTVVLRKLDACRRLLAKSETELGRFASLDAEIKAARAIADGVARKLAGTRETFDGLAAMHAVSSWESVRGNGSAAEAKLKAATDAIVQAEACESAQPRKVVAARAALETATQFLVEAESHLTSIEERANQLAVAKRDAAGEIDAAAADIEKARRYLQTHSADFSTDHFVEVEEAARILEEARDALKITPPDYVVTLKKAQAANKLADRVLAAALSEIEAKERLERQAVSSLRDAERAISKAKEFIQDHEEIDDAPGKLLKGARRALTSANRTEDLATRVRFANDAASKANEAYDNAKGQIEAARRRRQRREYDHRSDRNDGDTNIFAPVIVGGGGGSRHDDGGSIFGGGGGGSTNWGGFGGGGGGSSGW